MISPVILIRKEYEMFRKGVIVTSGTYHFDK